jgi:tetratricopeptide (TPR) repeat protein
VRRLASSILFALTLACGGPFKDAMKRGDQYANAGMWDEANAEYQKAARIEPGNSEVAIKLRQVARKRSTERLARGQGLVARGEIEAGLAAIQEAVGLDPNSPEAQRALADTNARALAKAEELLATPEASRAFDLTQLVLKGSPNDPHARTLDGTVRDALAEQSYERAKRFTETGKQGNALIEYAACLMYRPAFRDAKAQVGAVKLALQTEITFYVVLDRFGAAGTGERDIAGRLHLELVAQAFDERLPLRIVTELPHGGGHGVHVSGALSAYRFGPMTIASRNAECDYIRGYDTVPNPEREQAEQRVSMAEQQLASAEREIDQNQHDVDRYQRDLDDKQKDLDRYQSDADRARADYDRCQSSASSSSSSSSSSCSSERSRLDSAQSQLQSQRSSMQYVQSDLSRARESVQRANENRARVRRQAEDDRQQMRSLPVMIQVPHHERENYPIEMRAIDAAVTLKLHADGIEEKATLLDDEPFAQLVGPYRDEGWLARPATCPAQGKALRLPGEDVMRGELVKRTIATLREKVQAMYDNYRTRFLADARRQEASGLPEDAVESYVRYLLTGLKNIDPKDGKQIEAFLKKVRGFGRIDLLGGL